MCSDIFSWNDKKKWRAVEFSATAKSDDVALIARDYDDKLAAASSLIIPRRYT